MTEDPYSSPSPDQDRIKDAPFPCPACGAQLAVGWTEGSLRWFHQKSTTLDRLKGGRKVVGPSEFSITLGKEKRPSRHCEACGLTVILPK